MYVNQKLELSLVLDSEKFQKIFNQSYCGEGSLEKNEDEYVDLSLAHKGIVIVYRNSQYKKRIRLIVDPSSAGDDASFNADKFIQRLEKRISGYFNAKYSIHDFFLSGMILSKDIHVGTSEQVYDYLKVLKRIGRVKGFTPASNEDIDEEDCFCLEGNSNATDFIIYNLNSVMKTRLKDSNLGQKQRKEMLQETEGILRTEVHLKKRKAVQAYTDAAGITDQIVELTESNRDIFLSVFTQVVPYGDYYKKDEAMEILRKEVADRVQRRKMMRLLVLIPDKKSLHLAQREMNCRSTDKIMAMFARLNLSPVTISKRHNVKHLKNLYDYLLNT